MLETMQSTTAKRVYCLYRVSTLGQVEKDDIPMQKQACREYAEMQGWNIVRELSEKGVSGFKVSAKDRDAIQEIQRDALAGKFDILLVFMFDRLGRRDDETPFVVEWFVSNGIEVWSTMEGQQRFDTHVDKLLNYIRYWQASGESIKTSMRVKTRMEQLTQEGHYTGGIVPFGYRLENRGRVNKRNKAVGDLVVDPDEAEIVRLIFHKYVEEGYGSQRICKFLSQKGIKNSKGTNIPTTSINRIIKNPIYTGVICNGECRSDVIPELIIIEQDLFDRAKIIMESRIKPHSDIPLNTSGQSLLVGNIYCGHCGGRLTLTTSGRKHRLPDGTIIRETRARYACTYRTRHPGECDGQAGYGVKKLDDVVNQVIRMQFDKIRGIPPQHLIEAKQQREIEVLKATLSNLTAQQRQREQDYQDLRSETLKVVRGQSRLNMDLLNSLVDEATKDISELTAKIEQTKHELQELMMTANNIKKEYATLISWADMYDNCTFEAKKMIVSQFVKAVYVRRDYEILIEFNVGFEELQTLCVEKEEQPGA